MMSPPARLRLTALDALTAAEKDALRHVRNEPDVRRNMYTDHVISAEEHVAWLARAATSDAIQIHGVFLDGALIGAANFTSLDHAHKRSDWAFYLGEAARGKGVGSEVEYLMLERFFIDMAYHKLNCEVLETNTPVIRLHKKFGFQTEGVRRNHIIRDGRPVSAELLGMTREEWMARRTPMRDRLRLN